ncbi:MAG: M55 family metallopeptidase, partial [Bacillota bacterium]
MKVYISADLEGISGITHWDETGKEGGEDYQRARRLMT